MYSHPSRDMLEEYLILLERTSQRPLLYTYQQPKIHRLSPLYMPGNLCIQAHLQFTRLCVRKRIYTAPMYIPPMYITLGYTQRV